MPTPLQETTVDPGRAAGPAGGRETSRPPGRCRRRQGPARQPGRAARPWALALAALALQACQSAPGASDRVVSQGLQVADAALAVDQPAVARELYQSLVERYPDLPAPRLRLARVMFAQGDFQAARAHFLAIAELPLADPARAEALYGAGRAALALENAAAATTHFERARALVGASTEAAWIANGLAVAAALEADLARAEAHYAEAIALDPENPRIAANYVRLLIASGQVERAAQLYAARPRAFWSDDDARTLERMMREHAPG